MGVLRIRAVLFGVPSRASVWKLPHLPFWAHACWGVARLLRSSGPHSQRLHAGPDTSGSISTASQGLLHASCSMLAEAHEVEGLSFGLSGSEISQLVRPLQLCGIHSLQPRPGASLLMVLRTAAAPPWRPYVVVIFVLVVA